jgi:hypothetical protein
MEAVNFILDRDSWDYLKILIRNWSLRIILPSLERGVSDEDL